ncbi:hypothetical protein KC19_VG257900 [Ceratodon purpureus]|uniref:Uncharacterized protein n=1 Tax=Ceratodon purpureus TaxID=3225 RepID=A0A8T0HUF1_CERPU|nr:hypothetical protein KC19_VG257900 [Ceratodon purpureus]
MAPTAMEWQRALHPLVPLVPGERRTFSAQTPSMPMHSAPRAMVLISAVPMVAPPSRGADPPAGEMYALHLPVQHGDQARATVSRAPYGGAAKCARRELSRCARVVGRGQCAQVYVSFSFTGRLTGDQMICDRAEWKRLLDMPGFRRWMHRWRQKTWAIHDASQHRALRDRTNGPPSREPELE